MAERSARRGWGGGIAAGGPGGRRGGGGGGGVRGGRRGASPRPGGWGARSGAGDFLSAGNRPPPSPPLWGMASVPLTLLPLRGTRTLCYPLGLIPLGALLFVLD